MGKAKRLRDLGVQMKQVDVTNATPLACECGFQIMWIMSGKKIRIFVGDKEVECIDNFSFSTIPLPTGKELDAQRPVLVCLNCRKELTKEGGGDA